MAVVVVEEVDDEDDDDAIELLLLLLLLFVPAVADKLKENKNEIKSSKYMPKIKDQAELTFVNLKTVLTKMKLLTLRFKIIV